MTSKEKLLKNIKKQAVRVNERKKLTLVSNCCGTKLWADSAICPNCKEWCKPIPEEEHGT